MLSKVPYTVLDAPDLEDDFYLNLLDMGRHLKVLGVGLGDSVYLRSSLTSKVTLLCKHSQTMGQVTSVSWAPKDPSIAVGIETGRVQLWNAETQTMIRSFQGHLGRVGTLAWNDNVLVSGSRDGSLYYHDIRSPRHWQHHVEAHKLEVCGLKWSADATQLASGGNDNMHCIFDARSVAKPLFKYQHQAAVKALTWNPHTRGVLITGGGSKDCRIRVWSTLSGTQVAALDTGSQVCLIIR